MNQIQLWGTRLPSAWLSQEDMDYLASLPVEIPSVEWVWQEMDRVWHLYGLDKNKPLSSQAIAKFYSHPVWLMNGIFTQVDSASVRHRGAIAAYLQKTGMSKIADYGGGFGELALAITNKLPNAQISIIEPYPSRVGVERLQDEPRISFKSGFGLGGYDAIVAQDVLEHVEDPVLLACEIAKATREGGVVIFANCFFPVIECHLPTTFHLRHTFPRVMQAMGLRYLGVVDGAEHAQIFSRVGPVCLDRARCIEALSKIFGRILNGKANASKRLKQLARGRAERGGHGD